ncbi:MAG TPA: aldehyde dehydrogenase family protein, partial [Jiangellaceae bacterium]
GQFCTKPGLVFVPGNASGNQLTSVLGELVSDLRAGVMLTDRVAQGFAEGSARLAGTKGVRRIASGRDDSTTEGYTGTPLLLEATPDTLDGPLLEECFGPVLVVVPYESAEQLRVLTARLPGALTGTVHADDADSELARQVVEAFEARVGRVVWNGYPTGVAVTWAMHHGGPFPATTEPLHTSVGATSIRRWLRPMCYQNVPAAFLPPELRDGDASVPRRVDGRLVPPAVSPGR